MSTETLTAPFPRYSYTDYARDLNYSYLLPFEKKFAHLPTRQWMQENWTTGFYWTGIYLVLIFSMQRFMKDRKGFNLRLPLAIWSGALAVFSIVGAIRTTPELLYTLKNYGIYHSMCHTNYIENDKVSGFWTWVFVLSKLPELGDTVFIVLRKQPLIFLHWYHHVTVLLYSWYSYRDYISSARWYIVMNYCVHSIMYTYFALRALRFKVPKQIAMFITFSQLAQMAAGVFVNVKAYQYLTNGVECHTTLLNVKLSLFMYMSYLILFARLFYASYLAPNAKYSNNKKGEQFENGSAKKAKIG